MGQQERPWVIVVTWEDPEPGICVHGPFPDADTARLVWDKIESQYNAGDAEYVAATGTDVMIVRTEPTP